MPENTTFRVTTLDDTTADLRYPDDVADDLRRTLDRATTIVACLDCGDLAPITGGLPEREMPPCARCGEPMQGVTKVSVVEDDEVVFDG